MQKQKSTESVFSGSLLVDLSSGIKAISYLHWIPEFLPDIVGGNRANKCPQQNALFRMHKYTI